MGHINKLARVFSDKSPVPFVGSSNRINIFASGGANRSAELACMSRVGIINAIVSTTSQAVSAVDWKLYQKSQSGDEKDRIEVTRHPALMLLNKPNEFMSRQQLFEATQQHISLTGEGYWILEYGSLGSLRMPIGLWYARPDRMEPVKSKTEFLTGWIYKGPDGEDIPFETDEVIQFLMPDPEDPYRGMSPIRSVLTDIATTTSMSAWIANFFKNDATPGGIVEVPDGVDDDDLKRVKAQWRENHQGVSRAHRVAFLEGGMQWKTAQSTQKDMQFVEVDQRVDEKIRQAYHFPKPMLGGVDDVNRANADAAEVVFGRQIVVPNLERFKGELNNAYLSALFGPSADGLEFDYCNPVPDDQEVENATLTIKVSAYKTLIDAGVDPIAASEAVGLPEMLMRELPREAVRQDA
jgi:HK97 family phage portal protein